MRHMPYANSRYSGIDHSSDERVRVSERRAARRARNALVASLVLCALPSVVNLAPKAEAAPYVQPHVTYDLVHAYASMSMQPDGATHPGAPSVGTEPCHASHMCSVMLGQLACCCHSALWAQRFGASLTICMSLSFSMFSIVVASDVQPDTVLASTCAWSSAHAAVLTRLPSLSKKATLRRR